MSQAARTADSDRINYLNIALMLIACAVALYIPFQLFLFAYAVLGPAHYFTEISWLEKRHFFTRGKYDFWLLVALAAAVCFALPFSPMTATCTLLALGSALVLVLTDKMVPRILGLLPVIGLAFLFTDSNRLITVLLAVFVPTLIHVYLFTGFFMIYGALKERSSTGYLAFGIFLLCPLACWLVDPARISPGRNTIASYWNNFSALNLTILGINPPTTPAEARVALGQVFSSRTGLIVMRFIAFAYTYHYLNWFSKTSIIRWHEMGVKRLAIISTLWVAAVGIYLYDFTLGLKLLFYASVTHIYLEFPLNHISIIGTFREVRSRIGKPMQPALAVAAKGRK